MSVFFISKRDINIVYLGKKVEKMRSFLKNGKSGFKMCYKYNKIDKVKMKNRCYIFKTCIADFNSAPSHKYNILYKFEMKLKFYNYIYMTA